MDDHTTTAERAPARMLRIEFTGSGSEYFRIWIINLLLTLVTLGLYLPFAKARRLSYFYANTVIDGHALSFHGDPWRMFRGFVLLAVLMGTYAIAGRFSPIAGLFAFVALCALWPALWRASLQFRLANTGWRGLRMGFRGDLASAYKTMLPVYIPALVAVGSQFLLLDPSLHANDPAQTERAGMLGLLWLAGSLVVLALLPWVLAMIKRYQHGGYSYAGQQTRLDVPTRRFYGLGGKTLLMCLLPVVLMGALMALMFTAMREAGGYSPKVAGIMVAMVLSYLLLFILIGPFFTARLQNMIWNGTQSAAVRFDSKLGFAALAWLTTKNWLLTALTLSLYRPFAAVNTARLRLEAVSVRIEGDVESWVARHVDGAQDATGEAAGDFFGIDMGL